MRTTATEGVTKMKMIDQEALLAELDEERKIYAGEAQRSMTNCMAMVQRAQVLDAEEVVRCGDCRFPYIKGMNAYCPYMVGPLHGKGYCSNGERRVP